MMPIEPNDIKTVEVVFEKEGITRKIGAIVVPLAASAVQFLLTDEINEVMSIGHVDFEGSFTWVYGKPAFQLEQIEDKLRRLFEVGDYFRG